MSTNRSQRFFEEYWEITIELRYAFFVAHLFRSAELICIPIFPYIFFLNVKIDLPELRFVRFCRKVIGLSHNTKQSIKISWKSIVDCGGWLVLHKQMSKRSIEIWFLLESF